MWFITRLILTNSNWKPPKMPCLYFNACSMGMQLWGKNVNASRRQPLEISKFILQTIINTELLKYCYTFNHFIVKSLQKKQNSTNLLLWPQICHNKCAITAKWLTLEQGLKPCFVTSLLQFMLGRQKNFAIGNCSKTILWTTNCSI